MLTIETHYTKTGTVERMATVSGNKIALDVIFADIPCHVQPLQDSFSEDIDGGFGKDFLMFTAVRDIRQGDRITIDSQEYRVMSIEKYAFLGRVRHMEVRIRLFKS